MTFTWQEISWILVMHWVADFILQTHWQAINKSKRWGALLKHTAVYGMTLVWFMLLLHLFGRYDIGITRWIYLALAFGGISFVVHTAQDYFTSRWTSRLYAKKNFHDFFVVVGFDQILHYVQLFLTYHLLYH